MVTRKKALWQCPKCGHRFVTKNIWHSCGRYRLSDHFRGNQAEVRKTFDRFVQLARTCGPVLVYAQKTRIVLQSRVRFAGAVPRRDHLDASLWLRHLVRHPLIHRVDSLGRLGFYVQFRLGGPKDLDARIAKFMKAAYTIGQRDLR